jgi:phospholipid transport system substrate-binding protein
MKKSVFTLRVAAALLFILSPFAAAQEPIDILRENITRGIGVLEDPEYETGENRDAQLDKLCEITREIFDPNLFVRLALASDWGKFSEEEQGEFVDVFATFLCRYYLSRLQERYDGERVNFTEQTFKSDTRVSIGAEVLWNGVDIPIEVRMVLRNEKWTAFDLVVGGVSAVKLYRAEFRSVLREGTPADLIANIKQKTPAGTVIRATEDAAPEVPAEPEVEPASAEESAGSESSET